MATIVWDPNMTAVHRLTEDETLDGKFTTLHPLGAFLLSVFVEEKASSSVVATTDPDDDQGAPRVYQRLDSIEVTQCGCGNKYVVATWVTL